MKKPKKFKYAMLYPIKENPNSAGSTYAFVILKFTSLKEAEKEAERWAGVIIVKILSQEHEILMKGNNK